MAHCRADYTAVAAHGPAKTLTHGRSRALVALSAFGTVALAASVAHSTLGLGADGLAWQLIFVGVYAAAGGLCLVRAAWVQAERATWLCLGVGILLHGSGWLVDFVGYHGLAPMPSWSDPLWLSAYLGFYPGMVLLGRERFARRGVGMWLDGLLGGLALGAVTAATALQASLSNLDAAGSAAVTGAAYPLADIALLSFLATMFAGASWRPSYSGLALVAGLLVLVGVDTTYAIDSAHGGWFAGGTYDPAWCLAMLLLAAAAWLPSRRAPVMATAQHGLMFPSAFAAIAVAVLVYGQTVRLNPVAVGLAVLALLTVMVRMALLLRETATLAVSRRLSLTDDLTGLANRRAFTAEAEGAVADERPCALLMIDLDQFKELNDTLGHHVGDELLRSVGPRLSATMRPGDVVARLGGDEFGVLIKDADTEMAAVAAARLRAALGRAYALAGISLHVGASIGIATFPEHAQDASTLLRHADVAMYEAKRGRSGPRRVRVRGRSPQPRPPRAGRRDAPRAGQRRADAELPAGGRPRDRTAARRRGARALAPPRARAARTRRLPARHRAHRAHARAQPPCAGDGDLPGRGLVRLERPWRVAANLSATDLLDRSLVDDVSALLRRYGTPAGRVTLEVTESVLMTDPARAMKVLGELRGLGVHLALDDFGTGWSSLTHLQRMPVHEIKIDRSFVAAMATEANSAAIVSSTVDLAHALGLRVVAEGIEDEATWRRLRDVGCDAAQGYHLSRPLPAAEFETTADEIAERSRVAAGVPLSAA